MSLDQNDLKAEGESKKESNEVFPVKIDLSEATKSPPVKQIEENTQIQNRKPAYFTLKFKVANILQTDVFI
jgi:hypothetical protein